MSSMQDGQVEGGRDPPVGEERHPLDQFLVDFDRVGAGGLHFVHSRQRARPIEGDALACRAHGVVSLELLSLVETALGLAAPRSLRRTGPTSPVDALNADLLGTV